MPVFSTIGTAMYNKYSNKYSNKDDKFMRDLINKFWPLIYVAYILETIIWFWGLYLYFKCNWAKGVVSSNSDKILGFLGWTCCHPFYLMYHLVRPC